MVGVAIVDGRVYGTLADAIKAVKAANIGGAATIEALRDADLADIATAGGLAYHYQLNGNIKTPVYKPIAGNNAAPFTGTLNGQGHTVKLNITTPAHDGNGNYYMGLFARLNGAMVYGLRVDGNVFASTTIDGNLYVGGIVGANGDGSANPSTAYNDKNNANGGSIANCYVTSNVTTTEATGYTYAGGVAGFSHSNAPIYKCVATGSVTITNATSGDDYAGGIVGCNTSGAIMDCDSTGDVTANDYVGGIVGYNLYGGAISGCNSRGGVNLTGANATHITYTGGIAGRNYAAGALTNCHVYGRITCGSNEGHDCHVGGITGQNYYSGAITNCSYEGDGVIAGDNGYVGGIAGYVGGLGASNSITDCYVKGDVSMISTGGTGTVNYAGGIVGSIEHNGSVTNCYVVGDVKSGDAGSHNYAGGIAGSTYTVTVSYCYASGAVSTGSSNDNNAGGIVGYNYGSISNCVALSSSVTGEGSLNAHRIVGYNYGGGSIAACYGAGTLNGDAAGVDGADFTNSGITAWTNGDGDKPAGPGWKFGSAGNATPPWVWDSNTGYPCLYWE
jgi:hypothetical protein